jgi:uncharacterized RDD family membrane protein YckC
MRRRNDQSMLEVYGEVALAREATLGNWGTGLRVCAIVRVEKKGWKQQIFRTLVRA